MPFNSFPLLYRDIFNRVEVPLHEKNSGYILLFHAEKVIGTDHIFSKIKKAESTETDLMSNLLMVLLHFSNSKK